MTTTRESALIDVIYMRNMPMQCLCIICSANVIIYVISTYERREYLSLTHGRVNAPSDLAVYYTNNTIKSVIDHTLIDRINFCW